MSGPVVTEEELDALATELLAGREIAAAGALFDMDGTLVDSVPAVEASWRMVADEFGVPRLPASLHGMTAQAVVVAAGIHPDHRERAAARLVEIESRPGQELEALPGVRHFIESLPEGHWGVVTSAPREVARARYGAARLPRPVFFVTGDDVTAGKPDPEPFRRGLAALRARGCAGVVVAVEDTVAGLQSARGAGCLALGVPGTCTAAELAPHAHLVIDSFEVLRTRATDPGFGLQVTLR
ncbi:HAD-IA family hydrolase [Occultella gossypii]|uniref:HAD-IA family hydrolase n=1 Tax=Occultella gossypii TaxID=2800820 RepID=A0ABS7SBE7_9MICO|nr:HAD-IA family hydrolase [Occultella gossypii]MBZ2196583.1 HAD-IA family hydrolase [Occultella gossypii]